MSGLVSIAAAAIAIADASAMSSAAPGRGWTGPGPPVVGEVLMTVSFDVDGRWYAGGQRSLTGVSLLLLLQQPVTARFRRVEAGRRRSGMSARTAALLVSACLRTAIAYTRSAAIVCTNTVFAASSKHRSRRCLPPAPAGGSGLLPVAACGGISLFALLSGWRPGARRRDTASNGVPRQPRQPRAGQRAVVTVDPKSGTRWYILDAHKSSIEGWVVW